MTDTTMLRPLDAGAIDGGSREGCDRASILRLGQLFVLAVGVALVLVVAVTSYDLVAGLLSDVAAIGEPQPVP
ncbi:MAG TPA: hypothetical protein VFV42_04860 [Acidimicrobiales bacterium]|nr:hypothetical protein [Acidimicrobiales bacterium]